jgi:hypothetical protein
MADPTAVPFVFPDVAGRKVLVLGLRGGCDIITAGDQLAHAEDGRVVVPRGRRPAVPRPWLTTGFVFAPEG